jgi:TRAP transporter TAXI family solute receptor
MKRKYLLSTLVVILVLALAGCGSAAPSSGGTSGGGSQSSGGNSGSSGSGDTAKSSGSAEKAEKIYLSFPSGTTTGVYYPLSAGLAKLWSDKIPNVTVASQASNGSVQNLNLLQKGEAQVTLTPIGTLWEAYNGENKFKDRKVENVRVLAGLYPNVDQFVIRKGAATGIADLKGKGFVPGATASATEIDSKRILEAYGLTYDDLKINFVGFTEAIDLMRNKQVAGAMVQAGLPTAAVSEMTAIADGQLISLDDDKIKTLQEKYPWLVEFTIPANTYEGQDKDIKTVAQLNILVADASVSDELAYELVKGIFGNLDGLKNVHSVVKYFDVKTATSGLAGVPLHPGAEKYYKEKGVLK